jgi:hypothetical protein
MYVGLSVSRVWDSRRRWHPDGMMGLHSFRHSGSVGGSLRKEGPSRWRERVSGDVAIATTPAACQFRENGIRIGLPNTAPPESAPSVRARQCRDSSGNHCRPAKQRRACQPGGHGQLWNRYPAATADPVRWTDADDSSPLKGLWHALRTWRPPSATRRLLLLEYQS